MEHTKLLHPNTSYQHPPGTEFSFSGFHGAIAASTALLNGPGLSTCPLRVNRTNGTNGTNGNNNNNNNNNIGRDGVDGNGLVRRLAKAFAVWTRPSLAQWAELDLIEDAERRAVPGELGLERIPILPTLVRSITTSVSLYM